ncbi:MAG TPA: 30S ribosomal protein S16 [Frankiaceae bacterium]|nr:30S ribosomal protein S16 [Frankiaceae bacterium]
MATKIRLMRLGKMRSPYYRVVVVDSRTKRDGRSIETIGKYHPKEEPSFIDIDGERALHWLKVGAQPTEAVEALLKVTGTWQEFKGLPAPPPMRVKEAKADKKAVFDEAARAAMSDEPAERPPAGGKKARKVDDAADSAKPTADQMAADAAAEGQTLGAARGLDDAPATEAPEAPAAEATDAPAADAAPAETADETAGETAGTGGSAGETA